MNRRFYNYTCTIYRFGTEVVRGSKVEKPVLVYKNIKCALWKASKSYSETKIATQTDSNNYEINLIPSYSVKIGDIVETSIGVFKIDQAVEHHNSRGKLDNIQLLVSSTTKSL